MIEVYDWPCMPLLGIFIAIWTVIAYYVQKREKME